MERVDLHIHSSASDGSMKPAQVIKAACEAGLKAVALTDHDTVAGIPEAMKTAKKLGIECVPGIELSAYYKTQEIHIVGLFLDYQNRELAKKLEEFQQIRNERNLKMIQKMQTAGVDITIEKLRALEGDAVITRANLARYLLHVGYISSIKEAFDKYLSPGMPFFVPKTGVSPKDAITAVRKAGGVAVLAHPLLYKMTFHELEMCIVMLKKLGLQGIETYYSTYSAADERQMKRLAEKYGLVCSGGSDFHGSAKPYIRIGTGMGRLVIPDDILKHLKALKE